MASASTTNPQSFNRYSYALKELIFRRLLFDLTLLTNTAPVGHHFSQHSTASTPLFFDRKV
jgi:hypothetical protein